MRGKWEKAIAVVNGEGRTITYINPASSYTIESRLRHIPHANRSGTWDHTSYFVLKDGEEITEKSTLKGAKQFINEKEA